MANLHSSISFGLVNIPIIMNSVIKNNDTSFNQLHKKCGKRINYIKYCFSCKKEIKEKDIIKGYEYENDKYITFNKEELDKLKPEKTGEIEIVNFIPEEEIDPAYFEKSYVISAIGKGKAYNLFCEALKKSKLIALAKTVIASKFYYCVLRFYNNLIIMTTLYFEEELNIPETNKGGQINDDELRLSLKLINNLKGHFEPQKYKDEYQNNIKEAIDSKLNGTSIKKKRKPNREKINDLMTALEKSLKQK